MGADDRILRAGDRIDAILEELGRSAGPVVWPRVEELVQCTVEFYGAGLERILGYATAAGADTERFARAMEGDALVSSLLALHDLHPRSTRERVEGALEAVRPYLASHAGGVELLAVEGDTVRLRMTGTCDGCPASGVTLEHAIREAIARAAPEIASVRLEERTS